MKSIINEMKKEKMYESLKTMSYEQLSDIINFALCCVSDDEIDTISFTHGLILTWCEKQFVNADAHTIENIYDMVVDELT